VATTLGELDQLMADLPGTDLGRLPERRAAGPVQVPAGGSVLAWRAAWRFWLAIGVVAFVIWLLGEASGGPWFLWVAVPLGLLMLRRWIAGGPAMTAGAESAALKRNSITAVTSKTTALTPLGRGKCRRSDRHHGSFGIDNPCLARAFALAQDDPVAVARKLGRPRAASAR
jgi:hypothetical protein